ncbi:MAG TPA: hypothetical protein PK185_01480 [Cyclobacteriaceae bacterium]|nr:hypothetical protein [Cyclobacteriaceae bacterium]
MYKTVLSICLIVFACSANKDKKVELVASTNSNPYSIDISNITGAKLEQVKSILGEPSMSQNVNPSNAPCPCFKVGFKGGGVEVIFMNGKADWITINSPYYSTVSSNMAVYSHQKFSDYEYIKVTTP